ncbi:MAG: RDD family protein [Chryseotalea sp. WA131a]|nr:MAG: RDD family protein [Chryseotalea sp. WA131a]
MQTISVRTTQNIFTQYPLASVGDRILGYLIDQLIFVVYSFIVIAISVSIDLKQIWVLVAVLSIPYILYRLLFEIFMNGQTPGKRAMQIKVVRINGTPANVGDYVLRWIFGLIELNVASGLIAMLSVIIGGKGQRLGDLVAGTTVIKLIEQRQATAQDVFVSPENNYEVSFPQAVQLNPSDIELIQRSLEINRDLGNQKPMLAITEKVKTQLGVKTDMPPIKFLYVLIKDYNHLTSL